jgi:hypothetical protein
MHWATFMSRHGTFKYLGVQFALVTFRPLSVKRSSEPRHRPMSSSNVHRAGYRPLIGVSPRLFMTPCNAQRPPFTCGCEPTEAVISL